MNKHATADQKLHVGKEVRQRPQVPRKLGTKGSISAMPPKRTNTNNQYR